ncbi:MAG: flavocytochrome c [Desulfatitalea sp.]|nr:flavocytochrome c [Desulfatitalea sp.]
MTDESGHGKGALTRRGFLKTTGGAALAGVAAGGLFNVPQKAFGADMPNNWDEQVDVVVVGSGFAGLAAAIEAKQAGASVLVLEKMRVPGGNSIINGGVFAVAGSAKQEAEGIKDSPELLLADMLKAGLNLNHVQLAKLVAEKSREAVEWTQSLGVEYREKVVHLGGHSVPRSWSTHNSSGSAIVQKQIEKTKQLGIEIRLQSFLTAIIQDASGRVVGVKVREKYRFPAQDSGTVKHIKANKALVLAAGGFSADMYFRTLQDPTLTEKVDTTNQPGATAEVLLEALRIGSTPVQISWIQLGPWTSPDEKGMGVGYVFNAMAGFVEGVMVDPTTGKRFINELADRKIRSDAIFRTGHPSVTIADSRGVKGVHNLERSLEVGVVKKFDTIESLAAEYKIPPVALQETINLWNGFVEQRKDEQFDRYMQKDQQTIAVGPFYACRCWPKVHHTMGGVQINDKAQVIGLNRKPVPGLYAAGEVTGGVHGAVRLGSCAVTDCIVFGRIAGQHAAKA